MELEELRGTFEPLHSIIDAIIKNHKLFIQESEMHKQTSLPEEIMDRLKARKNNRQSIGGVIEDLLDLAEKVEKSKMVIPYEETRKPQD